MPAFPEHSPADGAQDDARAIDDLVFECLERLECEGWNALDELCQAHPDYAMVLRSRVEALRACGWLDQQARDSNG